RARAIAQGRVGRSLLHVRMMRQIEIIVTGEGEQTFACALHPKPVHAHVLVQNPAQLLGLQGGELGGGEAVERVHRRTSRQSPRVRLAGRMQSSSEAGAKHVWRPYAQMKTARAPLPVARTEGTRIFLNDGRVLIDGIASWWTACHGYN